MEEANTRESQLRVSNKVRDTFRRLTLELTDSADTTGWAKKSPIFYNLAWAATKPWNWLLVTTTRRKCTRRTAHFYSIRFNFPSRFSKPITKCYVSKERRRGQHWILTERNSPVSGAQRDAGKLFATASLHKTPLIDIAVSAESRSSHIHFTAIHASGD